MKRFSFLLILAFATMLSNSQLISAQNVKTDRDRKQWFSEMRRFKADFIAKELDLNEEQKAKFVPLYEEMDAKTQQIGEEARQMERNVAKKGEKVTDTEYEKAAEALYEAKGKEAVVDMEYFNKFKTILTKKQLFMLKGAERKFTKQLMDRQRGQAKKQHK